MKWSRMMCVARYVPPTPQAQPIRAIYMCVDCSVEVRELISYALHTYTRDPELAGVIRQKIFSPTRFAPSGGRVLWSSPEVQNPQPPRGPLVQHCSLFLYSSPYIGLLFRSCRNAR